MKNLIYEKDTIIEYFTSEYHHESRCANLLHRSPTLVWFTDNLAPLPQHVVINFGRDAKISRVGFYIHGENNQNPRKIRIYSNCCKSSEWIKVVDDEIEQKAGDYIYDVSDKRLIASKLKYEIVENFGGSGVHVSKLFAFGEPI